MLWLVWGMTVVDRMESEDAADPKGCGRPAYRPTKADAATVERMCSVGDSQDTIARALGIDPKTLRKHFADELLNGAARQRRKVVEMVYRGAAKGNASLIKRIEEMTRASSAVLDAEDAPRATRQPKLGKKEAAQQDALTAGAGNEWGDDLAPLSDRLN